MDKIPYGKAGYASLPLIDFGATDFLAAMPTIAAGDAKLHSDAQAPTNPLAKILGFDSMSEIPRTGDSITEDGGDGVAVVIGVILASGAVGTTGAGFMFVDSVTGTWTDNSTMTNSRTGTADFATVDAGTTGTYTLAGNQIANTAGLFAFANKRAYVAWTIAEATCRQLEIELVDTATKEWEDTGLVLRTRDHPLAYDPEGCLYAGDTTAISASGFTMENSDGVAHPLSGNIGVVSSLLAYVESATTGAGQAVQCASMVHATRVFTNLHNWPLTPVGPTGSEGVVGIKLHNALTRSPAHIVASNDIDFTATQQTYVPTTTAKTVLDLFAAILDQATGQLDLGSFAAGAIDAAAVAADVGTELADALLARKATGGAAGGATNSVAAMLQAGGAMRLTRSADGLTLTVLDVDGGTIYTRTLTLGEFNALRNAVP